MVPGNGRKSRTWELYFSMKSNSYFCPQDFRAVVGKECQRHSVLPSASPCAHLDEAGGKHGDPKLLIFFALFIRKKIAT